MGTERPPAADQVVLWEDDPVRRPLLAAILETAGISVARPRNADAALALAAAPRTAALVLDANVTRPSGAEFLRELRHRVPGRTPPVVALLQPGQGCLRSTMRRLGADRLLSEPLEPERLVATLCDLGLRLGRGR